MRDLNLDMLAAPLFVCCAGVGSIRRPPGWIDIGLSPFFDLTAAFSSAPWSLERF